MGPILSSILQCCRRIRKRISVVCPICGNSFSCPKAGSYRRYCPYRNERIRIQRYLCRNPKCSAVTFSLLPAFLLPIVSFSFTMLFLVALLAPSHTINTLAKRFACSRSAIRYRLQLARRVSSWLVEKRLTTAIESWSELCALFSRVFFPGRMRLQGINTTPPSRMQ